MSSSPYPVSYGIKNVRGGKKIICWVAPANMNDDRHVSTYQSDAATMSRLDSLNSAIASGAHEFYMHASVLAGVGELLPAGANLRHWSLNGHDSGGTARPDLFGWVAPPAVHAG